MILNQQCSWPCTIFFSFSVWILAIYTHKISFFFMIMYYDVKPGENSSTVAFVFSCTASLGMSFPVRMYSVLLWTPFTFPFLLTVFPAEMLLDSGKVTKCPSRVVVDTGGFRAHVDALSDHVSAASLPELPWKVVSSSMKLKVLVSLETLVANFTYKSVCSQEAVWW